MSDADEWGDPEPFGEDEDGDPLFWTCPNPECSTQKTTAAKAAAHCRGESGGEATDSPDTPRENAEEGRSPVSDPKGPTAETGPRDGWIDDPEFDGSVEAVREHHERVRPAYEALADLDGHPTAGFAGNSGWYHYRRENELELHELEAGHRIHRRAYTFESDYDRLVRGFEADPDDPSWRSYYNITSWKDRTAVRAGEFATEYDEYEQGDGLAGFSDMRGFALWVDFDLADNDDGADGPNYKKRRGALTDDERETVERALAVAVEEFADLGGCDPEDVAVFDSGGGAYLYIPAAVTLPIADRYEDDHGPHGDARALIFRELRARMFAYATGTKVNANASDYGFEGIETRVNERAPGSADLLDPDWMQNRNRQSKAPGAIHKRHDVAVTPARNERGAFDYTPTLVSELDGDPGLIERTAAEAAKIVAVPDPEELDAMTETFVSALFGEFYDRDGVTEWTDALDAWLTERREHERARAHQTALDERRQRERLDDHREQIAEQVGKDPADVTVADAYVGLTVTDVQKDVFDALENPAVVDVRDVIRNHCSNEWDTSNRGNETTFDPSWRGSSSGMSCAVPNAENGFVDNGCEGGGGPAKAYALGNGILPRGENAAAMPLRGRKWGEALDGLRSEGAPIPVYVPPAGATNSDGEEYDETPLWALRNAAVALDVCSPEEFKEHETDDGETYLGFDRETFNDVLDALDAEGIDHGYEHIEGGRGVEPVPTIPFAMLMRPRDELVRYARKRGLDWPTTDDARDRLGEAVREAFRDEGYTVLDAPTGLGKTHEASTTFWRDVDEAITGGQSVVLFASTRDARDEAKRMAREAGLDVKVLLGRHEACPVCRGDHDPENCDDELRATVVSIDEETRGVDFEIERENETDENDDEDGEPWTIPASANQVRATVERDGDPEIDAGDGETTTVVRPVDDDLAVGDEFVIRDEQEPLYIDGMLASNWFDHQCDHKGIAVSSAHSKAKEREAEGYIAHDKEKSATGRGTAALACSPGDAKCPTATQWPGEAGWSDDDGVPRYDLVVATDPFAYAPKLRSHKNIIHDEQPDYTVEFGDSDADTQQRIQRAVTAFLKAADAPGQTSTFGGLVHVAKHGFSRNEHAPPDEQRDFEELYDALDEALHTEPPRDWYFECGDAHTLAPALARSIYYAAMDDPDANGRRSATAPHHPPRLDANAGDEEGFNRTWVTVVLDDEDRVRTVRDAPDFSTARSVVGLDAWPNPYLWQRNVHPAATVERVLDTEERSLWRRLEQGKTVVGVGNATRPAGKNGKWFTESHADAIISELRAEFGDDFQAVGCASAVEERVRELLEDHGVALPEDPDRDFTDAARDAGLDGGTMHYGEENSRNDLAEYAVGLVYGCISPSDDYVLDLAAECDLDVRPDTHPCPKCDGEGCGPENDDCHGGECRTHGQEFVGEDGDAGSALLASVRENHVAQMTGRFGRAESVEQSVVFVATDATPPGLVDVTVPGVLWLARPNQKQRDLVEHLRANPSSTAREASDVVDCSKEHARQVFRALVEQGKATVADREGDHGADVYRWLSGASAAATPFATVSLSPEDLDTETTNSRVWDSYTWQLAIQPDEPASTTFDAPSSPEQPSPGGSQTSIGGFDGVDPPPERTD